MPERESLIDHANNSYDLIKRAYGDDFPVSREEYIKKLRNPEHVKSSFNLIKRAYKDDFPIEEEEYSKRVNLSVGLGDVDNTVDPEELAKAKGKAIEKVSEEGGLNTWDKVKTVAKSIIKSGSTMINPEIVSEETNKTIEKKLLKEDKNYYELKKAELVAKNKQLDNYTQAFGKELDKTYKDSILSVYPELKDKYDELVEKDNTFIQNLNKKEGGSKTNKIASYIEKESFLEKLFDFSADPFVRNSSLLIEELKKNPAKYNVLAEKLENMDKATLVTKGLVKDMNAAKEKYEGAMSNNIAGNLAQGTYDGLSNYVEEYANFAKNIKKNSYMSDLMDRLEANNGKDMTFNEALLLQTLALNDKLVQDINESLPMSYQVGDATGQSIGFMAEFIATSGGFTKMTETAIQKGIQGSTALAKNALKSRTKRLLAEVGKRAAGASVQALQMPSFYKDLGINISEGESVAKAAGNAFYDAFTENFSERIFVGAIGKPAAVTGMGKWMERTGSALAGKKGLPGVLLGMTEEYFEEKIADIMYAPRDYKTFGEFYKNFTDGKQNAITLFSTSLITGAMGATSEVHRLSAKRKLNKAAEKLPDYIKSYVDKQLLNKDLTPQEILEDVGSYVNLLYKTKRLNDKESVQNFINATTYTSYALSELFSEDIKKELEKTQREKETAEKEQGIEKPKYKSKYTVEPAIVESVEDGKKSEKNVFGIYDTETGRPVTGKSFETEEEGNKFVEKNLNAISVTRIEGDVKALEQERKDKLNSPLGKSPALSETKRVLTERIKELNKLKPKETKAKKNKQQKLSRLTKQLAEINTEINIVNQEYDSKIKEARKGKNVRLKVQKVTAPKEKAEKKPEGTVKPERTSSTKYDTEQDEYEDLDSIINDEETFENKYNQKKRDKFTARHEELGNKIYTELNEEDAPLDQELKPDDLKEKSTVTIQKPFHGKVLTTTVKVTKRGADGYEIEYKNGKKESVPLTSNIKLFNPSKTKENKPFEEETPTEGTGRIVYGTSGSGKSYSVKEDRKNRIDGDEVISDTVKEMASEFDVSDETKKEIEELDPKDVRFPKELLKLFKEERDRKKARGEYKSEEELTMNKVYNAVAEKFKQYKKEGKTVVHGSSRFINISDKVYTLSSEAIQKRKSRTKKDADVIKDYESKRIEETKSEGRVEEIGEDEYISEKLNPKKEDKKLAEKKKEKEEKKKTPEKKEEKKAVDTKKEEEKPANVPIPDISISDSDRKLDQKYENKKVKISSESAETGKVEDKEMTAKEAYALSMKKHRAVERILKAREYNDLDASFAKVTIKLETFEEEGIAERSRQLQKDGFNELQSDRQALIEFNNKIKSDLNSIRKQVGINALPLDKFDVKEEKNKLDQSLEIEDEENEEEEESIKSQREPGNILEDIYDNYKDFEQDFLADETNLLNARDLPLSNKARKAARENILQGKDTVQARTLREYIKDTWENGKIEFVRGTGIATTYFKQDIKKTSGTKSVEKGNKQSYQNAKTEGINNIKKSDGLKAAYESTHTNTEGKEITVYAETEEALREKIEDMYSPNTWGNSKNNIVGNVFNFDVGVRPEDKQPYQQRVRVDKLKLLPNGNYHILSTNMKSNKKYDMIVSPDGDVLQYSVKSKENNKQKTKRYNDLTTDFIYFNADSYAVPLTEDVPDFKSSANKSKKSEYQRRSIRLDAKIQLRNEISKLRAEERSKQDNADEIRENIGNKKIDNNDDDYKHCK